MAFTEEQTKIISEHPLNNTLDRFRDKLRDNADEPLQEDVASLLSTLAGSVAAFNLPSLDGSGNHVRGGVLKLDQFRPLVRHVADQSSDAIIWAAVFRLINVLGPLTPPPSHIAPTFTGTPVKTSSSQLADSETVKVIEDRLFGEIKDCTFRNVEGFWDRFFKSESWREEQEEMRSRIMTAHNGKKWTEFPNTPDERPVWDWFRSLEDRFLAGAPYKLSTTQNAHQFKERKGQLDIFFRSAAAKAKNLLLYKDILVVGEQKKSYTTSKFKDNFLQLARYVRNIFADQPTRRFVHAFLLCGSTMELWVFDRSGAYSSGPFDIHEEPDKFARAFVGYSTMDDAAMGLDTFIERNGKHRYITVDDASGNSTRIRLDKAMVHQKAIVCRGTTCYKTENNSVAKFSWVPDKRKLEVDHLKLAEEKGVEGVARLVAHHRITSTAEIRCRLQFSAAHRFRGESEDDPPLATASTSRLATASTSRLATASTSKLATASTSKLATASTSKLATESTSKIYCCLVISPAGRIISQFKSLQELLESMRDVIKAYQSLFVKGNILHRNIFSNNIIITKPTTLGGFKGMLIDLDLAKITDSGLSGAKQQTGTIILQKWEQGSADEIAVAKQGHMTVNGLESIMEEFPKALDDVKPLCLKIRSILFGDTARLDFGTTTKHPDQLYKLIIAAYDEAIALYKEALVANDEAVSRL
ncbi:serine/threonine-protein kinase Sgk2 [Xylaria sp. FL0933]|nr:serine/threonine-protein kinase Sgk2 [Xylaria sp. FL0933]